MQIEFPRQQLRFLKTTLLPLAFADSRLRFDATRADGGRSSAARHQVQEQQRAGHVRRRLLRADRDGGRQARCGLGPERSSAPHGRVPRTAVVRDERGGGFAHVLRARRPIAPGDPRQGRGTGGQQSRVPVGGQPRTVHPVLLARTLSPPRSPSPAASPSSRLLPARGPHDATDFRAGLARETADAAAAVSRAAHQRRPEIDQVQPAEQPGLGKETDSSLQFRR